MDRNQRVLVLALNVVLSLFWCWCAGVSCSRRSVRQVVEPPRPVVAAVQESEGSFGGAPAVAAEGYGDAEFRAQANDDAYVVALTIFAEARGEPHEGRMAVASVIWNRAHGYHDMFAEVCMMNKQFSCWNGEAGKSLIKVREHKLDKKEAAVFRDCLRMAKDMMEDRFVPPVKATHYHSTSVSPGWARSMVRVVKIGNHVFYRV